MTAEIAKLRLILIAVKIMLGSFLLVTFAALLIQMVDLSIGQWRHAEEYGRLTARTYEREARDWGLQWDNRLYLAEINKLKRGR